VNLVLIKSEGLCVCAVVSQDRVIRVVLGESEEHVVCRIQPFLSSPPIERASCLSSLLRRERIEGGEILESNPSPLLEDLKKSLTCYLSGEKVDFSLYPLQMNLSPFTEEVLAEVRKIPYGKVKSYKEIANKIGTRAYRAVGQALGINPFPIIIPCHRVIRTDGGLGGFSAGVKLKKRLLELEGILT